MFWFESDDVDENCRNCFFNAECPPRLGGPKSKDTTGDCVWDGIKVFLDVVALSAARGALVENTLRIVESGFK
jgi:hypothetical protein